jgi:sigma-B regulation protein RsbU (phosphoserine phosphatase)
MVDPRSGEMQFCNAGHCLPYRLSAKDGVVPVGRGGAKPLGIRDVPSSESGSCCLRPGESLFLYTDGITDALDSEGEPFTEDRLEAALRRLTAEDAARVVRGVLDAVGEFVRGGPQQDDIAVMAVRLVSTPEGPA